MLVQRAFREFAPDLLVACNGHPMIRAALAGAKARGIATVFALRGFGYDDRRFFAPVDAVLTCSPFLTRHYRTRIGLASVPLPPPLDWATIEAPPDDRTFVTFVHPAPHKGLFPFARLADMLGARRPDIPLLVVGSAHSAGALNGIAGLDFARYPQILAAPAVPAPADYLVLTRVLLVPSVFAEPFGRVAAEAMVNGIPPIVSDRGGLPEVLAGDATAGGGGHVRPLPRWLTHTTTRLPSEAEMRSWFDAVCALWDDRAHYDRVAAAARRLAVERYAEPVLRAAHLDFFESAARR
jgi:glycosyltransferase involved in cell wall biosynthesis